MSEINYEQDVNIDPDQLDTEWLEQPRLMIKYAKAATQAKAELDHAKEAVEVTKANLDKNIRSYPEKYDISKITETVVQNTILLQDEYQEASQTSIEARHEFEMARYAVQAIQDRKEALENLVKLYGQQYFAGPSAPRDISKEWEVRQKQEQTDDKVKMQRGRNK